MVQEKDILSVVEDHTRHINELKIYRQEDRRLIESHEEQIINLGNTMVDLRERFGQMATHKDILELTTKIDTAINGLLKDALAAIPGKVSLVFAGIVAIIAIGTFILNFPH